MKGKSLKHLWIMAMIVWCMALFVGLAQAAEVTLAWDAVADADGYKVYYGTISGTYQTPDDVGSQTTHTITLDPGDFYFAVTAYNNFGESGYSAEVGPIEILPPEEQVPPAVPGITSTTTVYTLQDGSTVVVVSP